jgi:hypothetical protein
MAANESHDTRLTLNHRASAHWSPTPLPATECPESIPTPVARARRRRRQSTLIKPGELLGDVTGGLRSRRFLEKQGHTLIVTSDKEEPNSVLDDELLDADVVISQPFWPAYFDARAHRKSQEGWSSQSPPGSSNAQ